MHACMEEEVKKKGTVDLDWEVLLPSLDDEPPPALVVTTTAAAATVRKQSPPSMDGDEQEQLLREELVRKSDRDLEEAIARQRCSVDSIGPRLPDKGLKLKANLKRCEDELERRKLCRVEKVDDGCEKLTQPNSPPITGALDSSMQEAPSSLPPSQSEFTSLFCKKLEENMDSRTVNAFEGELACLGRCDRRKMRHNGQFSLRERHKSALSSRQSPFQCPTNLSVDVNKRIPSNVDQNSGQCSTDSPRHFEEKLSGSLSRKRKAAQIPLSNDSRRRNGETTVVVVDEEPELIESMQQADKLDECMKESKINYPSRDDPESVEIHYSDLECLAPEAYLSSTIMNFYIRFLQQPTSTADTARCNYHCFNTYFYNKLKEAVSNKNDKESSFVKFRRWWKGVNIFQKAYILLPIHENLHWSLVIICIPDKEDGSGPIILHLDSLGLHFSKPIFNDVKSFLGEEWKFLKQGEALPDLPIADRIWKNLPRRIEEKKIAVPQQKNEYDCGLFVLFFMERFIDEAPPRLKKKDLGMFGKKWFKPEEASNLRRKIRKILEEEFRNAMKDNHKLPSSVAPRGKKDRTIDF